MGRGDCYLESLRRSGLERRGLWDVGRGLVQCCMKCKQVFREIIYEFIRVYNYAKRK